MALNTESSVVAVNAGDGLEVDSQGSFGGTITLQLAPDTESGDFITADGNGLITVDTGTFLGNDGSGSLTLDVDKGIVDNGGGQVQVKFNDGEAMVFGTDSDVGVRYDTGSDTLKLSNQATTSDTVEINHTNGNINTTGELTEGASL